MGVIDSYITRGMDSSLFHFDIKVEIMDIMDVQSPRPLPAIPLGRLHSAENPLHIWQDSNDAFIEGMWHKILKAIMSVVLSRPGLTAKMVKIDLDPIMELRDVEAALKWLNAKGVVLENNGAFTAARNYFKSLHHRMG